MGNKNSTLTTGIDSPVGTTGNDTFTATATTLTASDVITGGAGTDTLNITGALTAALPAGVTLSGVEKVNATSTSTIGTNSSATAASASTALTFPASAATTDSITLVVGGVETILTGHTTQATVVTRAAAALTAALQSLGYTVSSVTTGTVGATASATAVEVYAGSSGLVTITGLTSGAALPSVTAKTATAAADLPSIAVTAGTTAASPVAYDISSSTYYAGVTDFTGTSDGGANVKVAKTTNATLVNTTGGSVNLDGGKVVAITTTGTSAVTVTSKGASTVTVTGGTGSTVDNVEDSSAATSALGTTLTAVTLTNVNGNSAVKGQGLTTLTLGGATTAARTITVTDAVVGHSLTINAAGTGYNSTGATEYQTVVTDAAARYITVSSSGAKNSVDLSNNAAMTNLTINGSAALKASVGVAALTSIDGSAATGNLTLGTLNAATRTVKGGAGNDSATLAATATATVDTGAGNDTLTLGSALAAGSSVTLGDGNDKLLSSSGSVAAGFNSTTGIVSTIDAGAGTDGVAASLVSSGNAALFKNFETLILDNTSGSVDGSLVTGITGLELASAGGGTYTNLTPAQSLTVTNVAANTATTTLTFTSASVVGTSDSFAINFNAATPSGTTAEPSSANVLAATIAAAGVENVTVDSSGAAYTWNSITMGQNANARTVTITGAKNLDITFPASGTSYFGSASGTIATGGGVSLIDGSTATGKLAISIGTGVTPALAGLTVKGGLGNDTITLNAVQTTVYGGGGADNFVVSAGVYGSGKVVDYIADGVQAGDKITFVDQGTEVWTPTAVSVASATSLAAAQGIVLSSLDGSSNGKIKWFVYGGNTYIVESLTNNGTITEAATTDVVVKIAGVVDLSSSTMSGHVLTIV